MTALDPARVRERLAELDLCVRTQVGIVERLDDLLDDERRELRNVERQRDDLRAHPDVAAVLDGETEQAVGTRYHPQPPDPWVWVESIAGGKVIGGLAAGGACEWLRDDVTGRTYVAPLDTPPPYNGRRYVSARLAGIVTEYWSEP